MQQISQKLATVFFAGCVVCLLAASAVTQNGGGSGYRITIFADEGNDPNEMWGHVFVGMSDGRGETYSGFNPKHKGMPYDPEGVVLDETATHIANCQWDVKRTYSVTKQQYDAAMLVSRQWNDGKHVYSGIGGPHCGDFVEAVARAAGIDLDLSWRPTAGGRNRPGLFGDYLRGQGGETSISYRDAGGFNVNGPINTGIALNKDDILLLTASGSILLGPNVGWGGPDGIKLFQWGPLLLPIDPSLSLDPGWTHGCLMARIRNDDRWVPTGEKFEISIGKPGVLELNVNDKYLKDNSGSFRVEVKIGKKNCQ